MSRSHFPLVAVVVFGASFVAWAQLGGPQGIDVPFTGYVDEDGAALNDSAVDFRFRVFTSAIDANVCDTIDVSDVVVVDGRFALVIDDVAQNCVVGTDAHIEVAIDEDQGGSFTALTGRQRLFPAVAAMTSGTGDFHVQGALDAATLAVGGASTFTGASTFNSTSTFNGNMSNPAGTMSFGTTPLRQTINLYSNTFGIGVQGNTMYTRTGGGGYFAWFNGGAHNDNQLNPGGGTLSMYLDPSSNLKVTGAILAGYEVVVCNSPASFCACTAGKRVLGGGTWCSAPVPINYAYPVFDGPNDTGTQWEATCYRPDTGAIFYGKMYAICARIGN